MLARSLPLFISLLLMASFAGPADSANNCAPGMSTKQPVTMPLEPGMAQPSWWVENGYGETARKGRPKGVRSCWVSDASYEAVVLKAGSQVHVWTGVVAGDFLCTPDCKIVGWMMFIN